MGVSGNEGGDEMKTRILVGIALLVCGAAANADRPPSREPARPCTPGTCFINVTVKAPADSNSKCTVQIDTPTASTDASVVLVWIVNTEDYVFASDGIVFDKPDQFDQLRRPKPNEIRVRDKHTEMGDFYYMVKVDGCEPLDPYIRNN
jgi:hypothetical protein